VGYIKRKISFFRTEGILAKTFVMYCRRSGNTSSSPRLNGTAGSVTEYRPENLHVQRGKKKQSFRIAVVIQGCCSMDFGRPNGLHFP
jgi:hypothetical protein